MKSTAYEVVLAAMLVIFGLSGSGEPGAVVVERGEARASIVVGRHCSEPSRFAAEELQRTIRAMSGADCQIATDEQAVSGRVIAVGLASENRVVANLLQQAEVAPNSLNMGEEGFALFTVGGSVVIVGACPRAALYGAYALLERWGCRWCFPGPQGEVIPQRPTLALPPLRVTEKPALSYRTFLQLEVASPATADWIDWMAKNRMNRMIVTLYPAKGYKGQTYSQFRQTPGLVEAIRRRGIGIEAGNHAGFYWIPPAEFFGSKPEFYSQVKGKQHTLENLKLDRGQLCYANEEVAEVTARRVIAFARANPEVDLISLYTNDGYGYCECDRCAALGSASDAYCTHVSRVAERVYKVLPAMRLSFLSYSTVKDPPRVRVFGKNTLCAMATWPPPDENRLKGWQASGAGQVALYEYYMGSYSDRSFPWVATKVIGDELQTIHRLGLVGVASQCELDNWTAYALNYWVFARMAWNLAQPVEEVVADYCSHYYGEAAQPMRAYFAELESQGRWPRDLNVPGSRLETLEKLLAAGERAARTEPTRARILRDRISLDYLKLAWRLEEARRAATALEEQGRIVEAVAAFRRTCEAAWACLEHLDRYAGRRVFLAGRSGDPGQIVGHFYTTGYYENVLAKSEKLLDKLLGKSAAGPKPVRTAGTEKVKKVGKEQITTPVETALQRVRAAFHEHLRGRAVQCPSRQISERFPASREEWLAHTQEIRNRLRTIFHFPKEDVPLEARVVGRIDRGEFVIEKVIYRAETGNCVTANLYVPQGLKEPLPAIICPSGHGGSKSTPYNQYFAQMYAKAGCVVLVPDPIGEEERDEKFRLGIRGHRLEHRIDRCQALGISVIGKMVYDVVRGVDYLQSRSEVDQRRIGCAGHSLGGTVTEYATAVDPRITLSMPTAWTCNFHEIVGELSCCWRPVGLLQAANNPELLALGAPHCATLVPAGESDRTPMYPAIFQNTTMTKARRVYELFGRGDCLAMHVTPKAGHHPFQLNRTALAWVERHFDLPRLTAGDIEKLPDGPPPPEILMAELPKPFADKSWQIGRFVDARAVRCDVRLLPAERLRCLKPGDEAKPEFGMAGWMAVREKELGATFTVPRSLREWEARRNALVKRVAAVLNLPAHAEARRPQELAAWTRSDARVIELKYGLLGLSSYLILPEGAAHPPVAIYLHESRTKEGALESSRAAKLLAQGTAVLALDCVPFEETTYLLSTSPTVYNVRHVIESLDALEQIGDLDLRRISCIGEVDDVVLLAAVLDQRIASVTLSATAGSTVPRQSYRQSGVVPGLAAVTPRSQLMALLAPRPLRVETKEPDRELIQAVYSLAGAAEQVEFAPLARR